MLEFTPHNYMFDSLGQDNFDRMCHQFLRKEFGGDGYTPGPRKGKDGGIDSSYPGSQAGVQYHQLKFREIAGGDGARQRREVIKEFEDWLESKCGKDGVGSYVYITNVRRTKKDHEAVNAIIANYPKARIEYWDFEKLAHLVDAYPEISKPLLKVYDAREIDKLRVQLEKQKAAQAAKERELFRQAPEFQRISRKFKTQYIDWPKLASRYHAFVYLFEPLYLDDHDKVRAVLRDLFQIDEDAELKVHGMLMTNASIDITGNIITANNPKIAQEVATDMIETMGRDLEEVISQIQGG